jgi:hypothetical protein
MGDEGGGDGKGEGDVITVVGAPKGGGVAPLGWGGDGAIVSGVGGFTPLKLDSSDLIWSISCTSRASCFFSPSRDSQSRRACASVAVTLDRALPATMSAIVIPTMQRKTTNSMSVPSFARLASDSRTYCKPNL